MSVNINGFFAYSSSIPSIGETIEEAIKSINSKNGELTIKSWTELNISGSYIINSICNQIDSSEVFICELTDLNQNVLFELGYSISKKKKIILFLDTSIELSSRNFDSFGLLSTIGYHQYKNSKQIESCLFSEDFSSQNYNLIDNTIENSIDFDRTLDQEFLYLRSLHETDASIKLARTVQNFIVGKLIIDDPAEVKTQSLDWYIQHIINSYAVIAHFEGDQREGHVLHNAKLAFVCGISYGLKIPLLMLAQQPYRSPIDYREILKTYDTASKCEQFATDWFKDRQVDFEHCRQTPKDISGRELKARSELHKIYLGDIIAENDDQSITEYFIKTSAYEDAIRSNHSIFVGRKGCGKTANLIKLSKELDNSSNHVCIIKPINYELAGILDLLSSTEKRAERGFLVESLWKFIIYSEIIKSVYDKLKKKPFHYSYSEKENEIIDYVESNIDLVLKDFSSRLEMVVNSLKNVGISDDTVQQKEKISELLHKNAIGKIRIILGNYFYLSKDITILIDNLDKSWVKNMDIELMSEFLFGLLDVGYSMIRDFSRSDSRKKSIELNLHIFLRADIYHQISKYAPEKDKLPIKKIVWNDKDVLLGVIEKRMSNSENINIWDKYFCDTVLNIQTRDYIFESIIPKPRDIIVFCRAALQSAVNKRHSKINSEDINYAEKEYSKYAFDTLLVETTEQDFDVENLLYGFIGVCRCITYDEIKKIIRGADLDIKRVDEIIDLLCYLSFLGLEIQVERFEFIYDEEVYKKYKIMSDKTAGSRTNSNKRFLINKAFCSYLEIDTNLKEQL